MWVVFWIGGLEFGESKYWKKKNPFILDLCWIYVRSIYFPKKDFFFLNEKPKPPIQTAAENPENFGNVRINLGCRMILNLSWIYIGCMLNIEFYITISVKFMSNLCQIHAKFMYFQWFLDLGFYWVFFLDFGWWIYIEFILNLW